MKLKDKAVLVGYDPSGKCVYSAFMTVHEYYDGDHPWDDAVQVKALRLRTVRGLLFDAAGKLDQEFESQFNIEKGTFEKGWSRDEDGILSDV